MSNAALAKEGVVVVELKDNFKRKSSLFKKIAQGRRGGYVWSNTQKLGGSEHSGGARGQTLAPKLAEATAECAVALWRLGQSSGQLGSGGAANGVGESTLLSLSNSTSSSFSTGLPCACLPVGGGDEQPNVRPGVYGIALVGHNNECTNVPVGDDCHAGLITKPNHHGFDNCHKMKVQRLSITSD